MCTGKVEDRAPCEYLKRLHASNVVQQDAHRGLVGLVWLRSAVKLRFEPTWRNTTDGMDVRALVER